MVGTCARLEMIAVAELLAVVFVGVPLRALRGGLPDALLRFTDDVGGGGGTRNYDDDHDPGRENAGCGRDEISEQWHGKPLVGVHSSGRGKRDGYGSDHTAAPRRCRHSQHRVDENCAIFRPMKGDGWVGNVTGSEIARSFPTFDVPHGGPPGELSESSSAARLAARVSHRSRACLVTYSGSRSARARRTFARPVRQASSGTCALDRARRSGSARRRRDRSRTRLCPIWCDCRLQSGGSRPGRRPARGLHRSILTLRRNDV